MPTEIVWVVADPILGIVSCAGRDHAYNYARAVDGIVMREYWDDGECQGRENDTNS